MASKNTIPAAIEGLRILVCGQKIFSTGRPVRVPRAGKTMFAFDVKERGNGTIEEEYSPKKAIFYEFSLLDLGDTVSGSVLWGLSSSPLNRINVGQAGRTSSHSGQDVTCRGISLLTIINGWRGDSIAVHPKQEILSESDA